jgi:hypothetical protein
MQKRGPLVSGSFHDRAAQNDADKLLLGFSLFAVEASLVMKHADIPRCSGCS